MRVMMLGLRGFPDIQGGIESHVEHLAMELSELDCELEIIVRAPYWESPPPGLPAGISFTRIWSPRTNGAEAFAHSLLGVLYAGMRRPDVLHIHAIGPALFAPLARALGLRVVVTHHGRDYEREKWGGVAKWVLRVGEQLGMRFADQRIVVSRTIQDGVQSDYGLSSVHIPNGVNRPVAPVSNEVLDELGLEPGRYVLHVGRMVPEKRQLDLIRAFASAELGSWKLVLVGRADSADPYVRKVSEVADATQGVILAGLRTGEALRSLYGNAGVFVLPSTHEGHPIALLEALSHGLPVIASDIDANKEVQLTPDEYFRVTDVKDLTLSLNGAAARSRSKAEREATRERVLSRYNWPSIAQDTLDVYRSTMI